MDRQYQYVPVGDSDYHGLLSYDAGQRIDPMDKEGIGRSRTSFQAPTTRHSAGIQQHNSEKQGE